MNKTMSGPDSTDVDMANIYFTYKTSNEARLALKDSSLGVKDQKEF